MGHSEPRCLAALQPCLHVGPFHHDSEHCHTASCGLGAWVERLSTETPSVLAFYSVPRVVKNSQGQREAWPSQCPPAASVRATGAPCLPTALFVVTQAGGSSCTSEEARMATMGNLLPCSYYAGPEEAGGWVSAIAATPLPSALELSWTPSDVCQVNTHTRTLSLTVSRLTHSHSSTAYFLKSCDTQNAGGAGHSFAQISTWFASGSFLSVT